MAEEKEPLIRVEASQSSYRTCYEGTAKTVPQNERINYTWNDINVFVPENSTKRSPFAIFSSKSSQDRNIHVLKGVNGVAYSGELLAILGSSGAGKTTLLNSLTFRSQSNVVVTGLRCCNGTPVNSNSLTSQCAYVQQEDLFMSNLTVKEHLTFQALLRMDRDVPFKHRMKRVEEVISDLGLSKCQDARIGIPEKGISGGERKRLSFASEVLTNPSLMFCDEPTSGLDSFMALNVVQVLKGLARTGKTVLSTIHQPSSEIFALFDKILLMTEGRVAFLGTPQDAAVFFDSLDAHCPENYNPADFYIQLLAILPEQEGSSKHAIKMICDSFEKSDAGVNVAKEAANTGEADIAYDLWQGLDTFRTPYKASWCAQFRAVLWRSWLNIIKEPALVRVRFIQTMMVAVMISALYFGQELNQDGVLNINGAIFMFLTSMTFQNVFAVINVFNSELHIFLREHRNGMYRTDVYFLCKTIAEAPIFIFLPMIFTIICYYSIGLNSNQPRIFIACAIVTLMANAATSFGYLVSCASKSVSMALTIGPPIIVPFLILGGFILNVRSIPPYLKWLSYLSWFRYAEEALMINQWQGVQAINCTVSSNSCPRTGHIVLDIYGFKEEHLLWDIICLLLLICLFRLLAFFALLKKTFTNV